MVRRLTITLVAGSFASLGAFTLVSAPAAAADTVCPATLLPGQVCTTVDTVVNTLVGTTATTAPATTDTTSPPTTVAPAPAPIADPSTLLEPVQQIPLLPAPTSPVPAPSAPPSNEGTAPAPSTSPGAGAASPASHPAATNTAPATSTRTSASPIVNGGETARSFDLPSVSAASGTPFVLDPAPVPSATQYGTSQLAAAGLPAGDGDGGPSLPRPTGPLTIAVLLVAGVLGAHGVRWVDRATATVGR